MSSAKIAIFHMFLGSFLWVCCWSSLVACKIQRTVFFHGCGVGVREELTSLQKDEEELTSLQDEDALVKRFQKIFIYTISSFNMGNTLTIGDIACIAAATVTGVQLFSSANPIGSSLRLLKQLRSQVCFCILRTSFSLRYTRTYRAYTIISFQICSANVMLKNDFRMINQFLPLVANISLTRVSYHEPWP